MKKSFLFMCILLLVMTAAGGCGKGEISNDIVSIRVYKGLEVAEPSDSEQVWEALLNNCTVEEYPEEELNDLVKELETQYRYAAYDEGKTASELIEEIHGMTTEELAKEQLKKKYAVQLIAEEEKLNLTQEEYEYRLAKRAEENGIADAQAYESMFGYDKLSEIFLEVRVMEFLIDNLEGLRRTPN